MGVGRRMKKQGMPMTLEDLGIEDRPIKKRKIAPVDEPKKLVRLDRATRKESDGTVVKKQKKKHRLIDNDAQITVPLHVPEPEDDGDEDEGDIEAIPLNDAQFDDELDDMVLEEVENLSGLSDESPSVFDSEEETHPKGIFSEDEDEEDAMEQLNAANIEGLSRQLDKDKADMEAEARQELEDDAMQTNIAEEDGLPDAPNQNGLIAPDLQLLRSRMTETIRILGNFAKLSDGRKSRADYTEQLLSDICAYYGYTPYLAEKLFNLFSPDEAFQFFEANETPRPIVVRTNTLRTNRRTLANALQNRGVRLQPVGKWSKVGLQIFEAPVPLGATPEYLAGHYILQAASSFLPVMALAPQPGERVLDMAAAPGGKTTYLSALMRNTGAVFANDANRQRAKGLIGNVHRLGCKNVIVCNYDAQKAFPKILGGFDRVLLDAPCSGTGVIGKDPSVKTSKNERDFLALPHLQKQLLLAAIDSVDHHSKSGGYIVYSTCSVTVEENEGVVQYILRKSPNVKVVDSGLGSFGSPGFTSYMGKNFDPSMNLTRRYFPHRENVDGFFVCKLKKIGHLPKALSNGAVTETSELTNTNGAEFVTSETDREAVIPADDFAVFDDEADQKFIEQAESKYLKARGVHPRSVDKRKNSMNGDAVVDGSKPAAEPGTQTSKKTTKSKHFNK